MIMISKCFFNFNNFYVIICCFFSTKLLALGILPSTAVNAEFVTKLLILGVLFSILVILVLQSVFFNNSTSTRILFSYSVLSAPYLVFKTNPLVSILFTFSTNLS